MGNIILCQMISEVYEISQEHDYYMDQLFWKFSSKPGDV